MGLSARHEQCFARTIGPRIRTNRHDRWSAKVDTGVERYLRRYRRMHPLSLYLTATIARVEIAAAEDATELTREISHAWSNFDRREVFFKARAAGAKKMPRRFRRPTP